MTLQELLSTLMLLYLEVKCIRGTMVIHQDRHQWRLATLSNENVIEKEVHALNAIRSVLAIQVRK